MWSSPWGPLPTPTSPTSTGSPASCAPPPDFRLLRDAVETAEAMGVRADVGQVFTADQFYNDNPDAGAMYRKFGILALEMETAGLYWTASGWGSGRCPC